jgi:hypothetical protein
MLRLYISYGMLRKCISYGMLRKYISYGMLRMCISYGMLRLCISYAECESRAKFTPKHVPRSTAASQRRHSSSNLAQTAAACP